MTITPDDILKYCLDNFDGLVEVNSWGERGVFYNPGGVLKRGVYILTIKEKDGDNDRASRLDRKDVWRVNVGVRKPTFRTLFTELPQRPGKGCVVDMPYDFTATDVIMPHPVYAWMGWICALTPSETTFESLKPYIFESYEYAKEKFRKKMGGTVNKSSENSDRTSAIRESIKRYNDIVESNEPFCMKDDAWYMMGLAYRELSDDKKAVTCFKKAAAMNYPEAFAMVGDAYCDGLGVKQNPVMAFRWYRKGADIGETTATLKLAECYKLGIGCKADYSKAMEEYLHLTERTGRFWQKYADGIGMALYEIGNMYLLGTGVPKDLKKAAKYFRLAAENGNIAAENALNNKKFRDFKR